MWWNWTTPVDCVKQTSYLHHPYMRNTRHKLNKNAVITIILLVLGLFWKVRPFTLNSFLTPRERDAREWVWYIHMCSHLLTAQCSKNVVDVYAVWPCLLHCTWMYPRVQMAAQNLDGLLCAAKLYYDETLFGQTEGQRERMKRFEQECELLRTTDKTPQHHSVPGHVPRSWHTHASSSNGADGRQLDTLFGKPPPPQPMLYHI